MATVYRNLGILVDREEIRKISIMGEPDRYEKSWQFTSVFLVTNAKRLWILILMTFRKCWNKK